MAQPGLDPVFKLLRQKLALMFEYLLTREYLTVDTCNSTS